MILGMNTIKMENAISLRAAPLLSMNRSTLRFSEIKTEIVRKFFHFLIALVPFLASISLGFTMILVSAGTVFYALAESLRLSGHEVFLVSRITQRAARQRDTGRFVLGPVTLGIGALLALSFYPNPAAAVAIYALAFGDGCASLFGKLFGTIRLPFTGGKSLEGSLACFLAVFVSTYLCTGSMSGSFLVAAAATLIEAAPLKDFDNIAIPCVIGYLSVILFL
jgi:phytol kinase